MSRRLVIGVHGSPAEPWVVSSNPTQSTLSRPAAGADGAIAVAMVQHAQDADEGDYTFFWDNTGRTEIRARVAIEVEDPDDLQPTYDALKKRLSEIRLHSVALESGVGNVRLNLPDAYRHMFEASAESRFGGPRAITADVYITSPGDQQRSGGGGPDDTTGADSSWEMRLAAAGYLQAFGEGLFPNPTAVNNWLAGLAAHTLPATTRPPQLRSSDFKFHEATIYQPGAPGIGQHAVRAEIRQVVDPLQNQPAFANLVDWDYNVHEMDRPPNVGGDGGEGRGRGPGKNISIRGHLQYKLTNGEYNSGTPTQAWARLFDAANRAIDAIVLNVRPALTWNMREMERRVGAGRRIGDVEFEVNGVALRDNRGLLDVFESLSYDFDARLTHGDKADGHFRTFAPAGGMKVVLSHRYAAKAFFPPPYERPLLPPGVWKVARMKIPHPKPETTGQGEVLYALDAEVHYIRESRNSGDIVEDPDAESFTAHGLLGGVV